MTPKRTVATSAVMTSSTGTAAWWQTGVIYENHLPSFRDGNGDGIGDLHGLDQSLDYLADTLGIDAIWVGPCFRSPLLDQGFDISDYYEIESTFGTLEALDELIAHAHAQHIKIILDYVPNHTSSEHPWFIESRRSRDNNRRDWYVWRGPRPDGSPPNNWTSEAGGSVWEFDEATGQYYLHSHLAEQPDLNWRNPEVRDAMLQVLRFWLDRGVDGFRIDVAHMLMKDPEFRDNPPNPAGPNPYDLQHPDFDSQLHIYDRLHPDTHEVLQQIRRVVNEYDGTITIAEIEAMPWKNWAEFYGDDLNEIHLPFAFRLIETPWNAQAISKQLRGMYKALPDGCWPVLALGNHDRPRLATRLGDAQARVAALMLLTLQGTPCLLYGDELGMRDQPVPTHRQRDYFARTTDGVSRDPVRTPMPWNGGANAGFSSAAENRLWLPIARDADTINVEHQLSDSASMLSFYIRILHLRRSSPALHRGAIEILSPSPASSSNGVLVYRRTAGTDTKLVACSLTGEPATAHLGQPGVIVADTSLRRTGEPAASTFLLGPDEALIVDAPGQE